MLTMGFISFSSCSSDDEEVVIGNIVPTTTLDADGTLLQSTEGIIKLTSGIDTWDEAYLTNQGYFCYNENFDKDTEGTISRATSLDSKYSSLAFMPLDKSEVISIITTKKDRIPTQMVTKNGIFYFSFPNDSILELLYSNGSSVEMLDSIPYKKDELPGFAMEYKNDILKAILSNVTSLIKINTSSTITIDIETTINTCITAFNKVCEETFVEDTNVVSQMSTTASGVFEFTTKITLWQEENVKPAVSDVLSLWTGKASFKVGGSSCTLSGTIWCSSNKFNDYGTYGILCDTDPSKLTIGNAEYEGIGYQGEDDLSFEVDFRGFKPNTTYYYRAYYKFNSENHGGITIKGTSPYSDIVYDNITKTFTTGDNILTVDVVMCIDVTGSMSSVINTVKSNAIAFYDQFKAKCDEADIILSGLNSQVISFRDKNVDYEWITCSDTYQLPEQKEEFDNEVKKLLATGGGDIPESGLESLQLAFEKNDWGRDDGYHRQIIILWTDAPYLIGSYSDITLDYIKELWNNMPSGRRLILFAPNGTMDFNGASWSNLDNWKNVIHETSLYESFNNFDYILDSIIGELTSKANGIKKSKTLNCSTSFTPNN